MTVKDLKNILQNIDDNTILCLCIHGPDSKCWVIEKVQEDVGNIVPYVPRHKRKPTGYYCWSTKNIDKEEWINETQVEFLVFS